MRIGGAGFDSIDTFRVCEEVWPSVEDQTADS